MSPDIVRPVTREEQFAWGLTLLALVLTLKFHLLVALLTGTLAYGAVRAVAGVLSSRYLSPARAPYVALALLTLIVSLLGVLVAVVAFAVGKEIAEALPQMLDALLRTSTLAADWLPDGLGAALPQSIGEVKKTVLAALQTNMSLLPGAGVVTLHTAAHLLIGPVIGGIVALHPPISASRLPLVEAMVERPRHFERAFRNVVYAQMRISAVNASLTWFYLAVLLPWATGVELAYTKTLVALTLFVGLMPVVGNLISNTAIVLVSLDTSLGLAGLSLGYLISIHKLEYFLNAKIIGSRIRASSWELLVAMLVMEAVFGIRGLVAAPIFYAYLKSELSARRLC